MMSDELDDLIEELENADSYLKDDDYHEDQFVRAAIRAVIARLKRLRPPEGAKTVRVAVVATESRAGFCCITEHSDIRRCLDAAREEAIGEGWNKPVIAECIATIHVPPVVVPEVVGEVES